MKNRIPKEEPEKSIEYYDIKKLPLDKLFIIKVKKLRRAKDGKKKKNKRLYEI